MRFVFLACMAFILLSCKRIEHRQDSNSEKSKVELSPKYRLVVNDSVYVTWNNINSTFESYENLNIKDEKFKCYLISMIKDTNLTTAKCCSYDKYLRKGDLYFLLTKNLYNLPIHEITGMQFDFFDNQNCFYPDGLISYLAQNRNKVANEISGYNKCR